MTATNDQPLVVHDAYERSTYRAHLLATGAALYAAARTEQTLALPDLSIALTGRRAVLDLLTAVHADLTGLRLNHRPLQPVDIESHPVEALGRALHRYPRPSGELAPTDVALAVPVSDAGLAWQVVAKHATVAHHAWTSGAGAPLSDTYHWAGIVEVATYADALARLDLGLVVTAAADRRLRPVTWALRDGVRQGLGVAARETLRLAGRGPLPDDGPERTAVPPLRVITVTSVIDLPEAQRRLAVLLERGGPLRPERIPALAGLQARSCLVLADTLGHAPPKALPRYRGLDVPAVQATLRRHATHLQEATVRRGSIASVIPGDGRPVYQASEIGRLLHARTSDVTRDLDLLTTVVTGLGATTRALATAAGRALTNGEWMVPNHEDDVVNPLWHPWHRRDPVPSPVTALRRAAAHSVEVAAAVAPPTPSPSRPPDPQTVVRATSRPRTTAQGTTNSATELVQLARRPRLPSYAPLAANVRRR